MSEKKGVLEEILDAVRELTVAVKTLSGVQIPAVAEPKEKVPVRPPSAIMIVGHDLIIEKKPEAKALTAFVEKFAKLNRASEDVLIYTINRLSLWKAAERFTSDRVIDFLKQHAKTAPKDSLKRWISGTMSQWGMLQIESQENYEVLKASDEKALDRVYTIHDVKGHLFRRIAPTKARIIRGHRGYLKQALIDKGYPVKDVAGYEAFEPLKFELKTEELLKDPLHRWEAYEKDAVEEFLKYGAGTIVLPGGSGKTVIAVAAAAKLKAPTLVLATRSEILKQFKREFLEKTTITSYYIGLIDGKTPASKRVIKPITLTTYQMATGALARQIWNMKWGLVIFDESQHIPAKTWSRTTRIQATRRLGLTATPIREDKQEKLIFSLIGPGVYERGWLEMAEEGYIAKAKAYEILVDMPARFATRYNQATNEREKYILASTNPGKYSVIAKLLEKHAEDRVLIIGYYIQGAIEIGAKFNIPVVYGEVSTKQRTTLYDKFRKGEIDKLVLTSVGEEGIDLPDANVLIEVCANYASRMQMGQRFSRILRPKKEGAVFYEVVSRGTTEQDFSNKRRQFLIGKGYEFTSLEVDEI